MQRLYVIILIEKFLLDSDPILFDYSYLKCSNVHKFVNTSMFVFKLT